MSRLDIFDNDALAKFASLVGDSWRPLARRLGIECLCDNPASCLRNWRDTFSREHVVQKLTWVLTKFGESLGQRFTKSIDEEQLDDWLKRFAYSIDSYWQSFAKELDFNEDEIQTIVGDLDYEPVKCQAHHMVMEWKKKYIYGNTMGALKLAVWEMRRHDLLTALGEDVLDDDMINDLADKIGCLWPMVAVYLGFNEDSIQMIADSSSDDESRATTMLAEWRERIAPQEGQKKHLAHALSKVDLNHDLAEEMDPSSEPLFSAEPSSQPSFVDKVEHAVKPITDVEETDEFKIVSGAVAKVLSTECKEGEPEDCMFELLHEAAGEYLGVLLEMVPFLKDGIVVFQKGKLCFYALKEANAKWETGELSKVETLQYAIEKITEAVIEGGLTIGGRHLGRFAGGALGALFGSVVPIVGTCFGGVMGAVYGAVYGGKLCTWVGKKIAPIISRTLGTVVPRLVSRNDIKVLCIDKLETGDHVITEDGKGIHAIVCGIRCQTVTLVHCDASTNMVRQETVWFRPPWRRVIYRDADTRARAVAKAKDSIGSRLQEEQSSEQFAKWCKFKQK
ncbi:uncharacterized protein [Asterias amurensis]|uniref:uncharacterized protein n=1 Tax=Asterias amurensis TaxID=7602 RepID=UPI003AB7789E